LSPAAYDLTTDEAMRVAAVFAEYDKNSDGIINLVGLCRLSVSKPVLKASMVSAREATV
jgi:hypothetical protein